MPYNKELKIYLQPLCNKKREEIILFRYTCTPPFFLNYWFPKLELELKLFLTPTGVCISACQEAAVCAAVGKLGTAQLGAAQPRMELTTPVPESLHFSCMTGDNRWVKMGDDENSGILDSLKSQLLSHSLMLPSYSFTVLFSQQSLLSSSSLRKRSSGTFVDATKWLQAGICC